MSNRAARFQRRLAARQAIREEEAQQEERHEAERRVKRTKQENDAILKQMGIQDRRRAGRHTKGSW